MRETRFIDQNKEKWREAETLLESPVKDPDKLSNLFVQVIDDLSYSRTYYSNRSVRVYLNKIARQYFSFIYSHKKEKQKLFRRFWLEELPQIIISSKKELLVSLAVFVGALCIGVFSAHNDPDFAATILGEQYIAMTNENIESGDPMAVYKKSNQIDMFLGITLNNLMVAFRTYVLGIFLAVGTIGSLLFNGVMVGCFQYYFAARDLLLTSSLSIWLHGTLEISSIILAGGAGLTLASGLIFPGTYSRLQSFQRSGVRSLKLMLGITPIFVLAAVIESFLTRYTDAPMWLKLALIILSAIFIIGYFVFYPWLKAKKGFEYPLKDIRLAPALMTAPDFSAVKTNADILKDTFHFYSRYSATVMPWMVGTALCVAIATFVLHDPYAMLRVGSEWWITLLSDMSGALDTPSPEFILINALGQSVVLYVCMRLVVAESAKLPFTHDLRSLLYILFVNGIFFAGMYAGILGIIAALVLFGFLTFSAFAMIERSENVARGLGTGWQLFTSNGNQGFSLQLVVFLLAMSFLVILSAPLAYIHVSILQWNFVGEDRLTQQVIQFLQFFMRTFFFYLALPVFAAAFSYLYFSQAESASAENLKQMIDQQMSRQSRKRK